MPNIDSPQLTAHLDRCWDLYRHGHLADVAAQVDPGRRLLEFTAPDIDEVSRANADTELTMLSVLAGMLTVDGSDAAFRVAAELADRAAEPAATFDTLHRLGAFAVGVHAAMRTGRLRAAELRFRQVLAAGQGLNADGEPGVSTDDVCAVVGCASLHLAEAAAVRGDNEMAAALLDQSDMAAAELGREHEVLGQYFGPQHVRAMRSISLAELNRLDEAVALGRTVDTSVLMPLVAATLLRTMADCCERQELLGMASTLRARGDSMAPSPTDQAPPPERDA